ncbi:uncharacterized protein PgNI_07368 [Pyricularia grisea]|uniref:C6 transcription factor RegA n=1 Tax=Pyricularia grisea TaxID=148305 RepID=A0A6P8B369_PYRGI|nr:uncharacterized protein PgNI_07368 [Pyricularia grisea]TLD09254.1 hypothetical protein PgNI_07368 [Pyricularia grisea]
MAPPQSAGDSSAAPSNMFQCGICARSYSRADHLTRHIRSHTQHKPYTCQHCGKSFGRIDLLRRHVAAHDPENALGKGGRGGRIARGQHLERRVSQACRNCSQNHLRCSDTKPCSRCVKDGLECVWPQQHNQPKQQLPLEQGNLQAEDGDGDEDGDLQEEEDVASSTAEADAGRGSLLAEVTPTDNTSCGSGSVNPTAPHLMAMDSGFSRPPAPDSIPAVDVGYSRPPPHNTMTSLLQPNITDHMEPMPHIAVAPPEGGLDAFQVFSHHHHDSIMTDFPHSPRRLPAYAFLNADFDLNEVDLGFLESYNTNIPFNLYFQQESPNTITSPATTRQETVGSVQGVTINESSAPAPLPSRSQRSRWRFVPNKNDHGGNEEQNLSLPTEDLAASPESRIHFQQGMATSEPLRTSTRDKLLCMIVENCRPDNRVKAVSSFPSTELLNVLIQFYLTSTISQPESFIHLASFNPNTARPELVAGIIAHGAVMTLDPTFVKLGFAIQECVRVAIPRKWESDNRVTRDLELAQAFLINLRISLWSGDSRKMEIAESFLQPLLTILRRAGNLQRSRYPPLNLQVLQTTENLDGEWRRWVELESWKRLVFQLWLHDADNSIALLVPPLLSYAEFHAPLPDHPSTWRAGSAEEWRRAQLHQLVGSDSINRNDQSQQFVVKPSIVDYLADFNTVDSIVSIRVSVDQRLAKLAFLAGTWRLSWEYNQLKALQRPSFSAISHSLPPAGQTHLRTGFFMTSRYDELHNMLDRFALGQDHYSTPDVTLRLEVVRLSLDVPLADVQFFAGLDGPEEARRVHPALRLWVSTPSARRAVAHAGQVVRAARRVSKSDMSGLSATALYHSAQVLLVYGALLREAGVDTPRDSTPVFLDGEDREAIERFVHLDRGSPAVRLYDDGTSAQQPSSNYRDGVQDKQNDQQQTMTALLSDSPMVLEAVTQVLKSKYEDGRRPVLIDSIIQLLTDLGGNGSGV